MFDPRKMQRCLSNHILHHWLLSMSAANAVCSTCYEKKIKKIEPLCSLQWLSQFLSGLATCVGMHGYQETSLAVSSSRGPREGCLRQRALRVTHGPSWSSLTCCRRAVVSTFWGPPSGPPPPSLPLLSSLGHLGVQQQL